MTEPLSLYDVVRPRILDIDNNSTNIQSTIDNLHQGYTGTATTGLAPSDLNTAVGASINGRLTVLEGKGVLTQYTTSATWTKPTVDGSSVAYTADELWTIICINGGQGGACVTVSEAPGGFSGGYVSKQFKYSDLPATASMTIGAGGAGSTSTNTAGTAGGATSFGSLVTGSPGLGSIAKADGSYATAVPPGQGGNGGAGFSAGTGTVWSPTPGVSGPFAVGGIGGLGGANAGSNGSAAPSGIPSGGGGGGGGAGSNGSSKFVGGAGGFPGGGGGGGGSNAASPGANGGAGAAGCIYVIAPH